MAIATCPTCKGEGGFQTRPGKRERCWCSLRSFRSSAARQAGFFWANEDPPGEITRVVKRYLFSNNRLSAGQIKLLKFYVGQFISGVLELGRLQHGAERHEAQREFMAGWEEQIARVGSRSDLNELKAWLEERHIRALWVPEALSEA